MSGLRNGWREVTLGEVGRWYGGGTPSKANPKFWNAGTIPWVSPKDMKRDLITDAQDYITQEAVENSATNLVEPGNVLVVVRSGILRHTLPVAIADRKVALNQDLKAVRPREDINARYLLLALKAFERDILHSCTKSGTTVQNLEIPAFLRFKIPVAPFEQQPYIVAEIEKQFMRLEAGVAGLRRVQANLKRYRAVVLKAACEGKLVPTEAELARQEGRSFETGAQLLERILIERRQKWSGKGKYKEPAKPDTANLPEVPEGWVWGTVDQLSLLVTDGDHNPPKRQPSGVPHLTAKNIQNWGLNLKGCTFVSNQDAERVFKRYRPIAGDIIITCVGTVGRTAIVPGDVVFSPDRNLAAVRLVLSHEMAKYVNIVLSSPDFQERIENASGSTAQPHFT